MDTKLNSAWVQVAANKYKCCPPKHSDNKIYDCTLPKIGRVRNGEIRFEILPVGEVSPDFHIAILFRKNGEKYLGAGLGGWGSYYSVFNRTLQGFIRMPMGSINSVQRDKKYSFSLEYRGGFLVQFKLNEELLLPFQGFSFRDSLASTMSNGNIGLYSYGNSQASLSLRVSKKPARCFIITNIDGDGGMDTTRRRKRFKKILGSEVELLDSRDLTRESPLMAKIKSAIVEADLVIADFGLGTPRPNVFYETGIAHSVGVPTIHIGPKAKLFHNRKRVPSDMRSQFYVMEEEIDAKLGLTVKAILEKHHRNAEYLD